MKKFLIIAFAFASVFLQSASAAPAYPGRQTVKQPDGSYVTFQLHGDESFNYMTTPDGYLLARKSKDVICYATFQNGMPVASNVAAADNRHATEAAQLRGFEKASAIPGLRAACRARLVRRIGSTIPLDTFRGLVILVNYSDLKFSMDNPMDFYYKMLNDEGYTGFEDPQGVWRQCTGSLHDYFKDNSLGMFAPDFDVVGPVEVNLEHTFVNQTQNANALMKAALDAADGMVDFSKYDSDNDGVIDMVYFIFPGYGSNSTGGKELWPHASDELTDLSYDGKKMGHYACSTEMFGTPANGVVEGIGTICHEFSHLLGLPDEYDTSTGGLTHDVSVPGYWSVMSMGCYVDNCLRPVGYSLMERQLAGFSKPEVLNAGSAVYSLSDLQSTGNGYMLPSYKEGEYFLLENRQPVKWDANLPGHGLLVYRVDRSDLTLWDNNQVNNEAGREHYLLLRAQPQLDNSYSGAGYKDTGYDAFPGEGRVTSLSDVTSPSLRSLYGYNNTTEISDITEDNGVVSFRFNKKKQTVLAEIWDEDDYDEAQADVVRGSVASWLLAGGAKKEAVASDGGNKTVISMVKRSSLTAQSNLSGSVNMISLDIANPTKGAAIFQVKYSLDNGATWNLCANSAGEKNATVAAGSSAELVYYFSDVENADNLRVMIIEFSGVANASCHVGDIRFYLTGEATDNVESCTFADASLQKHGMYDLQGRKVNGATFHSYGDGVYIINGKKILIEQK